MDEKVIHDDVLEQDGKYIQYLTFTLGSDIYGIPVGLIREVDRYSKVFPVPKSPECVKGIINLRGEVIPIVDLNTRLFGIESTITKLTNIIILEFEEEDEAIQIGVIIDSVKEVVDINEADIDFPPGFSLNLRKDFVSGIGKVRDSFVILLDIHLMLNVYEISQITMNAGKAESHSVMTADLSADIINNGV